MKKIITGMICFILCIVTAVAVLVPANICHAENEGISGQPPFLYDAADLLSSSEEEKLLEKINEISERQQFAVVIITVPEIASGYTAEEYADDLYDNMHYGYGAEKDGTLLLVSIGDRKWHISTRGYGIKALTDRGLEYIEHKIVPDLSDGNYYESFKTFTSLCDDFVTEARNGRAFDIGHMPKDKFNFPKKIFTSFLTGFIIALIIVLVMKSKLKSVKANGSAENYIKSGSMNVTESRDIFLYMNVTKTARPKESSGGSSVHSSSSGASHGGRGGSF